MEIMIKEKVRAILLNEDENWEVANNLGNILEASLDLSKIIFPNKYPHIIFMEKDVYESYISLDTSDRDRKINEVLRSYFEKRKFSSEDETNKNVRGD
ncbi:hypothetical protein [Lysinibacillus boronitolerans]|uniref:hypothetical protein n=1 Tax=Lysinibacillus boronitolerans TaxID=309788 RepID=UPI0015D0D300|nr:hypothetical protein [Bacillus sp. Gen3]